MPAHVGDQRRRRAACRRQQRREADADERREIGARDLRRLIDGAVLRRQPRQLRRARTASRRFCSIGVRLERQRRRVYALAAPSKSLARVEDLADLRERPRVGRIERRRLAEVLERRVHVGGRRFLPLDPGQLAIQERAVGRARNRRGVGTDRLVEPAGARRLPRLLRGCCSTPPELQHLDAPPDVGQRRIDGERRLERGDRVGVAVEREQRLAAAEQRRHVSRLLADLQRPVEMRQRRLRVLPRQLDVAEGRLRRIEGRRRLQRRGELALGRLQIAGLQERPAAPLDLAPRGCRPARRGTDGLHEVGKLRRGHHRRRHHLRRARADDDRRDEHESSHRENLLRERPGLDESGDES